MNEQRLASQRLVGGTGSRVSENERDEQERTDQVGSFLLKSQTDSFANDQSLLWPSWKHGPTGKADLENSLFKLTPTTLCVGSLIKLLQRFGAILSYISGQKMQIWKCSAVPLANNMEAKHCAG